MPAFSQTVGIETFRQSLRQSYGGCAFIVRPCRTFSVCCAEVDGSGERGAERAALEARQGGNCIQCFYCRGVGAAPGLGPGRFI